MIIGITGKSGVGKSTYARKIAEENGFYVVHIDKIAHEVMDDAEVKESLREAFGDNVVKNSEVNRKHLGDLVFSNRHTYQKMRDLVWDMMKHKIDHILSTHENVVLDWILLPHSHYWGMCDKKILVTANEERRKDMVMKRDNISQEYLEKRDSASIGYDDFIFDEIIYNKYA